MDPVFFFIFGLILVALAVGLSYLGVRGKASFPPSPQALKRVTLGFAVIVAITAALSVSNASEEKKLRNEELAEKAAKEAEQGPREEAPAAPGEAPAAPGGQPEPGGEGPAGGGAVTDLALSSPVDGSLVFIPASLQGPAGTITLNYSNPSVIPHSIAIEEGGKTLDASAVFTEGEGSASSNLKLGKYVFYCTVPGHRESGMEGTLTVN